MTAVAMPAAPQEDRFASLHEAGVRPHRTQTYGQLDVERFLRDVGVRGVKAVEHTDWVAFRCPFHDDRSPSAAMHKVRTTWRCHACGCGGNAARLLSMLKGIPTRQAHHRIVARDYGTEIELSPRYVRKTSRGSTGSQQDIRVEQEHAVELLHKGASYSSARDALVALYNISVRTAERRLQAAQVILGTARPGTQLGARALRSLPVVVGTFTEEGLVLTPPRRSALAREMAPEAGQRGGSNKTANLTVSHSRDRGKLRWPGQRWQRPRVVRAGTYYELADGRVWHEARLTRSERDWLTVGTTVVEEPPTPW